MQIHSHENPRKECVDGPGKHEYRQFTVVGDYRCERWGDSKMNCNCGRPIEHTVGHNRYHTQFCSHYCYHYAKNPEAYPDVRVSDSKHHKNIWMRPRITIPCDWCGTDVILKDHEKHGNRLFCSRECSIAVRKKKNGLRDFQILKLLEFHGWQTSDNLQSKWSNSIKGLHLVPLQDALKFMLLEELFFKDK